MPVLLSLVSLSLLSVYLLYFSLVLYFETIVVTSEDGEVQANCEERDKESS